MGDPKKTKKHYTKPRKRWDKARIEAERKIIDSYGLKNKKEIRMLEGLLRRKRSTARGLLAMAKEGRTKREKELLQSLVRIGVLTGATTLDDVLSISLPQFMERRLQTLVWRKNLAKTPKQSRQFITHGHIAVDGQKVSRPGYLVASALEGKIGYFRGQMELEPKKAPKKKADGEEAAAETGEAVKTAGTGKEGAGEETGGKPAGAGKEGAGEETGGKEAAKGAGKETGGADAVEEKEARKEGKAVRKNE